MIPRTACVVFVCVGLAGCSAPGTRSVEGPALESTRTPVVTPSSSERAPSSSKGETIHRTTSIPVAWLGIDGIDADSPAEPVDHVQQISQEPTSIPFALSALALGAPTPELLLASTEVAQADSADEPSPSKKRKQTFSSSFNLTGYPWSELDMGDVTEEWDSAMKYELNISGHFGVSGHVEPLAGAYFYFEDREWDEGPSSIDYRAFGIGGEFGAMLYPVKNADEHVVNVALMPFIRLGLAFNDGSFDVIPTSDGLTSGDIDGMRFDISGGLEARAIIARTLMVGIGAGVGYFTTFSVSGRYQNGVGVFVLRDMDFDGLDAFARLTVGILF